MLNLKNNENDAVFAKKAKIKIKFQKMKGTFLDSILWLKSHQPPLLIINFKIVGKKLIEILINIPGPG